MFEKIQNLMKRIMRLGLRKRTHGEFIKDLLKPDLDRLSGENPVFVETGCGVSTLSLAEIGLKVSAVICSCDYNSEKANELRAVSGNTLDNVRFMMGDSLKSLEKIVSEYPEIHFVFLDSAASAMHTFREFMVVEKHLKPGARVLVDNAAIPGFQRLLGPVRKGKILVPYLLASPYWEVAGHPDSGDSMVSAILRSEPDYADPDYEAPEYIDDWRRQFRKKLK